MGTSQKHKSSTVEIMTLILGPAEKHWWKYFGARNPSLILKTCMYNKCTLTCTELRVMDDNICGFELHAEISYISLLTWRVPSTW